MNTKSLIMCAHCANLRKRETNNGVIYTCEYIRDIIPNGIVDISMDADYCIKNENFKDIKSGDAKSISAK